MPVRYCHLIWCCKKNKCNYLNAIIFTDKRSLKLSLSTGAKICYRNDLFSLIIVIKCLLSKHPFQNGFQIGWKFIWYYLKITIFFFKLDCLEIVIINFLVLFFVYFIFITFIYYIKLSNVKMIPIYHFLETRPTCSTCYSVA